VVGIRVVSRRHSSSSSSSRHTRFYEGFCFLDYLHRDPTHRMKGVGEEDCVICSPTYMTYLLCKWLKD
jgi:hypothetical protein